MDLSFSQAALGALILYKTAVALIYKALAAIDTVAINDYPTYFFGALAVLG